ncbi:FIST N-terminal domain-containing protein [Jannaschia formosa]|uniref:FIST N-terminal domain-containing protein n=1 Tax=Jannaschia formosa TaxID=2259592 RepID=UPI000E1B87AB|nr:FIST N-terminal domain-containing protein [Jannaschia formosa]TFL16687.1 GfdT protein [Jannaschia formosa]
MNLPYGGQTPSAAVDAFVTVELDASEPNPAARIAARIGGVDLDRALVFAAPETDLARLVRELSTALPDLPVVGCTTAGALGSRGYAEHGILVIGLPASRFTSRSVLVEGLSHLDAGQIARDLLAARMGLATEAPHLPEQFAFMMVDGLSLREDMLAAALAPALGRVPLFGGSAGDGTRFQRTQIAVDGRVLEDAAVVTFVATDYRVEVFSLDHLRPGEARMVVTRADPERRIVKEINAEPAAREYARLVGMDPEQLDEFTFASHPVVVRLGDRHHVRAIQRVNEAGELVFFSAIDEGMVLTVAEAQPMAPHLDATLSRLSGRARPAGILACDCVLRRIEAERTQQSTAVSEVLARHRVHGFSTYGEQIGPMHLNQTMTGVILFVPEAGTS